MSRVDEALARAAQLGDVAGQTVIEQGHELPPGSGADAWSEEPSAPVAEPATARRDDADPSAIALEITGEPVSETQEKLVSRWLDQRCTEQYRRLAARLHLEQAQRGTKVVMISSALPGEGKTLTATNLALTLSESYRRHVLLIDGDLRRPWVHELFGLPNVSGLNDGLRAATDRKVPLIRWSENLTVLTAGRPDPDPMSILSSDRMRAIVAEASATFDWVLIDTPPVGVLTDASLLAAIVDTVIMVVQSGRTPFRDIEKAVQAIGRESIFGVVLNRVPTNGHNGYDDYYRTYASQHQKQLDQA